MTDPYTVAVQANTMRRLLGQPELPPPVPTDDPVVARLDAIGRALGVPQNTPAPPLPGPTRPLPTEAQVEAAAARMTDRWNLAGGHRLVVDQQQAAEQRRLLAAAAQERAAQQADAAVAGARAHEATVADLQARLAANRAALAALDDSTAPPAA